MSSAPPLQAAPDGSPGAPLALDDPGRQFPVLRDGAPVPPPPVAP
ncbi:MAG TPA: hypothetical protein P5254_16825 [Aquihabitans sp.]|nr:hypothetical protein [Aquihabitans sp.]